MSKKQKSKKRIAKEERLVSANKFLFVIGSCGRRFFFNPRGHGLAQFSLDPRGRVWFRDDWSGRRIYTHCEWLTNRQGFTHGGTLNGVVRGLANFIAKGEQIHPANFQPGHPELGGDIWGYGEDMQLVSDAAVRFGIVPKPESQEGANPCL